MGKIGHLIVAIVRLLLAAPSGLFGLLRFLVRARRRHRQTFLRALNHLGDDVPSPHGEPLEEIFPRVYEIKRDYLTKLDLPALADQPLTFVHLPGTGEPLHAMFPGLETLFALKPNIATHRHLILDMPDEEGAFDGVEGFRQVLRALIDPALNSTHGGIVLVGLSRGGVAALDLGARLATSERRPIGVVAYSPPLMGDYQRPTTIRDISALEPTVAQLSIIAAFMPKWWNRIHDWILRRSFLMITSFTLVEFQLTAPPLLRWVAWDLKNQAPLPAILRSNREFDLLMTVSDAELLSGTQEAALSAATNPTLTMCMLWGEQDVWVPGRRCAERARHAYAEANVPPGQIHVEVLPDWGHAMSRQLNVDFGALAARLEKITDRVVKQST